MYTAPANFSSGKDESIAQVVILIYFGIFESFLKTSNQKLQGISNTGFFVYLS